MLKFAISFIFIICALQGTRAQFYFDFDEGCSLPPPLLPNGIYIANDSGPVYPVGTVLTYNCLDGFQLNDTLNKVTCQEDETFTELMVSCDLAPFLSECRGINNEGDQTTILYDECTSFCCGGRGVDNSTNLQCCGSELYGSPYNPTNQECCKWWTGHGKGHRRPIGDQRRGSPGCCGAERIFWNSESCCYGHPDPPQLFNRENQLCCNAHAVDIDVELQRPFWEFRCCGDRTSFIPRTQSCPCNDGQVLEVRDTKASCCESPEGFKTPYLKESQFCCNGDVGDISNQFCCGDQEIGTIGESVCCTDKLFKLDVQGNTNLTGCCNGEGYDPRFSICCDDVIQEIIEDADQCCGEIPFDSSKSICCDTSIHSIVTEGTSCCANQAFFADKGFFCCNGEVFSTDVGGDQCCGSGLDVEFYFEDEHICCGGEVGFLTFGDSCCGVTPFPSKTMVCCDGQLSDNKGGRATACCNGIAYDPSVQFCCDNGPFGPFRTPACCNGEGYDIQGGTVCCGTRVFGKYQWPSCCVNEGYDARTHSCCGATIRPNPNNSTQTGCCSDLPFDSSSDLCCDGEILPRPSGVPRSRAQCCDIVGVYNTRTQLCCIDTIFNKTNRFTSKCCGFEMYNTTEQICCDALDPLFFEPLLSDFVYGVNDTACCGNNLYNKKESACCDGDLFSTDFEESGCCSGTIFDRTQFICCENQLLPIGGVVPWQEAECCGRKCIFKNKMTCCNDRTYINNAFTQMDCETYVEP